MLIQHRGFRYIRAQQKKREQTTTQKHIEIKYSKGDFVLWAAVAERGRRPKLYGNWLGPYNVTKVQGNMLFEIQLFFSGKTHNVHVVRLRYYCDSTQYLTCELREYVVNQD